MLPHFVTLYIIIILNIKYTKMLYIYKNDSLINKVLIQYKYSNFFNNIKILW